MWLESKFIQADTKSCDRSNKIVSKYWYLQISKLLVIGLAIDNDLTLKDYINILCKRDSSVRCPLEEISFNKAFLKKMVFGTFRRSHFGYAL